MAFGGDPDLEFTREDFFREGMNIVTGYDKCIAGTAEQIADHLEEEFEATGSRGGLMVEHPTSRRATTSTSSTSWCRSCSAAAAIARPMKGAR